MKRTYYLKPHKLRLCELLWGFIISILILGIYSIGFMFHLYGFEYFSWIAIICFLLIITPFFDLMYSLVVNSSKFEKITLSDDGIEFFAQRFELLNDSRIGGPTKRFNRKNIKSIQLEYKYFWCLETMAIELTNSVVKISLFELSTKDYDEIKVYLFETK